MASKSRIEWTEATWNPITGCTRVSEGCRHCYAERLAGTRLAQHPHYGGLTRVSGGEPKWTGEVRFNDDVLDLPLKWRKPRRIFVNSMGDLFHEKVQDAWLETVYRVMHEADQHIYQVLTKRPDRMAAWLRDQPVRFHIWHGTSAENQNALDERVPFLLECPGKRFLSLEPLLGPITLRFDRIPSGEIDWVIVGGESGPGFRECKVEWIRAIVDECTDAGVPVFVKQDCGPRPGRQGRIPDELWLQRLGAIPAEFEKMAKTGSLPFVEVDLVPGVRASTETLLDPANRKDE